MGKYVALIFLLGVICGGFLIGVAADECIKSNFFYGMCTLWK